MHDLEPYYNWRNLYIADEDERSPFFGREYSEFEFTGQVYNYLIHPQWDYIGSETLYLKILFADYDKGFCIIEFIGEWNDCLYNDIMFLYRNVVEFLLEQGITKYILIGENILNFHYSDADYYQEWFDDLEEGWVVALNFRDHVRQELSKFCIDYYLVYGGELDELKWRMYAPQQLFQKVSDVISHRIG